MRIGELLLEHEWVDWEALALAVMQQRESGLRLCSLLVARKILDFDQASLALAEQHGVAAALRRHIEGRDRSVAALLPAALARRIVGIPIGRPGSGKLIVCVRDPSLALREQISRATGESIVLAVAPARTLERLVEHVYADIDVPIDVELPAHPEARSESGPLPLGDFDIDVDIGSDFDLDIEHEEPEPDIPVEIEPPDAPRPRSRALPVQVKRLDTQAARDCLDETIAAFPDIDDIEWLFDVLMGYVAKRWAASLLVALDERRAIGVRGHGQRLKPSTTRALILPLSEPSVVQLARDERRVIDETPADAGKRLAVTLDNAATPTAVPISAGDAITHVLVVGDPLAGDHDATIRDLDVLAFALGEALARLSGA